MSNSHSRFILDALPYDVETAHLGSVAVAADQIDFRSLSPEKQHFYCRSCNDHHGHFMRLVPMPEERDRRALPARFNAYGRVHSTHQCDHPVRYAELKRLAIRYGARAGWDGNRKLPIYNFHTDSNGIDSAERMAKVVYATMYDPGLRELQSLTLGHQIRGLTEGFYDDSSKNRLFAEAFAAAQTGGELWVATIFRPVGHRGHWKGFREKQAIPGQTGSKINIEDQAVQPSAVLVCRNGTYSTAIQIANRNGTDKSSAIMVIARAVVNIKRVKERIERLRQGEELPKAVHVNLIIDSKSQIQAWDHAVSFEAADKGKARPPMVQRQERLQLAIL